MMTCEKMRELILTDHIDNELSAPVAQQMKEHLAACPACAAFEAEVRRSAVEPFKDVAPVTPPPAVWWRVRGAVVRKWRFPKPAFAVATVAVMLIAAIFVTQYQRVEDRALTNYIEEELAYLSAPIEVNGLAEYDMLSDLDVTGNGLSQRRNFSRTAAV